MHPLEQRWLVEQCAGTEAARHHEHMRSRTVFAREMRNHLQAVARADGADVFCDGEHVERSVATKLVRHGKHLEWAGEIEDFNVVEKKDGDVFLHAVWDGIDAGCAAADALGPAASASSL